MGNLLLPPEYSEPYVPGNFNEKGNSLTSEVDSTDLSYTNDNNYHTLLKEHQHVKELLFQAEYTTKNTIQTWTEQKAMDSFKVHQLSQIISKQDQVILELDKALSSTLEENELLKLNQQQQQVGSNMDVDEKDKMNLELKKELHMLRKEVAGLQEQKSDYEQRIIALCSELETSQDQTRKLTLMADELKRDSDEQKMNINEKIEKMAKSLLEKDIVIQKYRNKSRNSYMDLMHQYIGHDLQLQQQRRRSRRSSQQQHQYYRDSQYSFNRDSQYLDDNATVHSATSFGSSYSDRSLSGSRLSYSSSSPMNRPKLIHSNSVGNKYARDTLPKRKEKAKGTVLSWPPMESIPPPTGPPPTTPLPPLPILENNSTNEKEEIDPVLEKEKNNSNNNDQQVKKIIKEDEDEELDEIKSLDSSIMSSHHHLSINPDDEQLRQGISSSLEMLLLLQSPSKFDLEEEEAMKEAYREFTEQLQSRLSISKEIDQLQVWDHEALERIQKRSSNLSYPTTTTSTTSSKKSNTSSMIMDKSSFNSDHHHHHEKENTAFWKGMKKKLRV
ncbi:unnamed protein product [Cunninghamella echinulata]